MPSHGLTKMTDLSDKRNISIELRISADIDSEHVHAPRRCRDGIEYSGSSGDEIANNHKGPVQEDTIVAGAQYKTYRRKWFGLLQLVLLNIIVSWDVGMFFRVTDIWSRLIIISGYLSPQCRGRHRSTSASVSLPSHG